MTRNRLPLFAAAILALGLCGCQLFHRSPEHLTVTPVAAYAPPRSASAPEDALYARAVAAINARDYGLALDVLQLARQDRAEDPRVLTAMAVVYDKLGRFDLSKRYYDQADAADPGSKVVEADRAYSMVLQQRSVAPANASPVRAEARNVVALPAAPPVLRIATTTSGVILLGQPVLLRNATGSVHGADAIRARLGDRGWSLARAASPTGELATSELRYPPAAQRAATGLVRTLPFPVRLESCPGCTRLELVIGADFASGTPRSRRSAKVQRA